MLVADGVCPPFNKQFTYLFTLMFFSSVVVCSLKRNPKTFRPNNQGN